MSIPYTTVIVMSLCLGLSACSSNEDPAPPTTATPAVVAPVTPATPAAVTPPPSDAVALSEEELDKVEAEKNELNSRAADLESQVEDGKALIALKEKQIKELEAQLNTAKK
jgi:hypothetical protein